MYVILTTCPQRGSRNVGDKLMEVSTKRLVEEVKGEVEFETIFREDDLTNKLDLVNRAQALLMPAFPIRDLPMYPGAYQLTEDLEQIDPPLIPIGANWNSYPGDIHDRKDIVYSEKTRHFLNYITNQVEQISCREYYTQRVLENHDITNTVMTGDPAWYDLESLGISMKRPSSVDKLVFTPPLSPYYLDQAKDFISMLEEKFPQAEKYCSFHLADRSTGSTEEAERSAAMSDKVTRKNQKIRTYAQEHGFTNKQLSHDFDKLELYEDCDLHVGYECHAHIGFIRKRIPSVLVIEDARGLGFSYTLGVGGFKGYKRCQQRRDQKQLTTTSGYCTDLREYGLAPAKLEVVSEVGRFIDEELNNGFRRYLGLAELLDETYRGEMEPFIKSLP